MGSSADTPRARLRTDAPALSRRTFLALAAVGAAAACSSGGPDVPSYTFPDDSLYFGAATPPDNLAQFEAQLGKRLSCYRSFFAAGQVGDLHRQVVTDLAAGRMPIPSIKPPGTWSETASNHAWIESLVAPLGDLGDQVFLCVHHEPEGDTDGYGTPADFVAMQQAVLEEAADSARNVVVVPILGTWTFDPDSKRSPSEWNVEDARVYGLDVYNPWSPTNGKAWVPFADRLALASEQAAGRPVLIGEYGCRTDPTQPGRAADWLDDAFQSAREGDVVAMAYFNSSRNSPDGSWELDAETLPTFADILNGPGIAWVRSQRG